MLRRLSSSSSFVLHFFAGAYLLTNDATREYSTLTVAQL